MELNIAGAACTVSVVLPVTPDDLRQIQQVSAEVEAVLKEVRGTRNVYGERIATASEKNAEGPTSWSAETITDLVEFSVAH
jgi:Cu/Ag efflux pump CusA